MSIANNELRIGNWINSDGMPVIVTGILDEYSNVRTRQGNLITCRLELAQPIHLSYEIFINFGFELEGHKWFIPGHDSFYIYGLVGFYAPYVIPEITSLHQLQNVFYSLTGNELTYSPI